MNEEHPTQNEDPNFTLYSDELLKSRALSDAELLQNGAEYQNGVLTPTGEQLDTLKQNEERQYTEFAMEDAARDARRILSSEIESKAEQPRLEFTDILQKKKAFKSEMEHSTLGINHLFDKFIPLKPHREKDYGEAQNVEWEKLIPVGNDTVRYSFDLQYMPDANGNHIDRVVVALEDDNDLAPKKFKIEEKPGLTLSFEGGELSTLTVRYGEALTHTWSAKQIPLPHQLPEMLEKLKANGYNAAPIQLQQELSFLQDFMTAHSLSTHKESFTLNLRESDPSIEVFEGNYVGWKFDYTKDVFLFSGSGKVSTADMPNGLPLEVSKDEFKRAVRSALSLIPSSIEND